MTIYCKKENYKNILLFFIILFFVWLLLPIFFIIVYGKTMNPLVVFEDLLSPHETVRYMSFGILFFLYTIFGIIISYVFGKPIRKIIFINDNEIIVYFFLLPPLNFSYSYKIRKGKYNILYCNVIKDKFKIDIIDNFLVIKFFNDEWYPNDWILIQSALEQNAKSVITDKYP